MVETRDGMQGEGGRDEGRRVLVVDGERSGQGGKRAAEAGASSRSSPTLFGNVDVVKSLFFF